MEYPDFRMPVVCRSVFVSVGLVPAGFGRPCIAGRCRRFDRRQGFSILSAAYGRLCGTVLRAFGYAARSLPEKRSSVPSEHRKNCRFAFRAADPLPLRAACVFCPDGKTGIGFRNRVIVYFKPKSVIRISQCCMAMRSPLISPRWTGKTALFLKTLPDRGYACPLFCPNKPVLRLTRIG